MTAFEDFVNLELPRRATVLLPVNVNGYDGNPNLSGEAALNGAPPGRIYYVEESTNRLWFKLLPEAFGWVDVTKERAFYAQEVATEVTTIKVDSGGSDRTGNGTPAAPFATLQRAVDSIAPDAIGAFVIEPGPEEYDFPVPHQRRKARDAAIITIVGYRDNPTLTFSPAPTWTLVTDRLTQKETDVSPQSFVGIGDATHWTERNVAGFSYPFANVTLASTSPILRAFNSPDSSTKVHPIATKLTARKSTFGVSSYDGRLSGRSGSFQVVGCEVDIPAFCDIEAITFQGCTFASASPIRFYDCPISGCAKISPGQMRFNNNSGFPISLSLAVLDGQAIIESGMLSLSRILLKSSTSRQLIVGASADGELTSRAMVRLISGIDVETAASVAISLRDDAVFWQYLAAADIKVFNNPGTLFELRNGAKYRASTLGAAIDGQTSGHCFDIGPGCTAEGLREAAKVAGSLISTGGREVNLNGNLFDFDDAPMVDGDFGARFS